MRDTSRRCIERTKLAPLSPTKDTPFRRSNGPRARDAWRMQIRGRPNCQLHLSPLEAAGGLVLPDLLTNCRESPVRSHQS